MMAVAFLAIVYTVTAVGLQGVVSPGKLQDNATNALPYVAQVLGGSGWAKVMPWSGSRPPTARTCPTESGTDAERRGGCT